MNANFDPAVKLLLIWSTLFYYIIDLSLGNIINYVTQRWGGDTLWHKNMMEGVTKIHNLRDVIYEWSFRCHEEIKMLSKSQLL